MNSGVYRILNLNNDHQYIGSAADLEKRWIRHRNDLMKNKHHSPYLQRAWNQYGERAFSFGPILFCSRPHLLMYEQIVLNSFKPEYNCAKNTFAPMLGLNHSDEAKLKMSESRRGKKFSDSHRANIAKSKIGKKRKPFSAEWIANISASRMGELSSQAKLSVVQVIEIRNDRRSYSEIAKDFGVTKSAINHIKNRHSWSHV